MAMNFENRYTDVSAGEELHLSDYLQAIVANWRTIAVITLAALVLGTAYAFLAQPVYRADVMIQVEDKANNNNNGKDTLQPLSGMFDTKPTTSAEIELLRSRLVTEETVKKLHLDIAAQPRYLPIIGGLVGDLVNGKWGFSLPPFIDLLVKTIMDIAHVGAIGDGVVAVIPVERFFRVRSQAQAIP